MDIELCIYSAAQDVDRLQLNYAALSLREELRIVERDGCQLRKPAERG